MKKVLNEPLMSFNTMGAFQKNSHIDVKYIAKAMGDSFILLAVIAGESHLLERQRGGVRIFKTLNAVVSFLSRFFKVTKFEVEAEGWNKTKHKEIAA
ncbi:MAG: hypothetical protein RPV21_01935 [Candidatus Sedimenticola sp. (ex Thyasira tokunagai)]